MLAGPGPLFERPTSGQIAVDGIMGRGLVGDRVGPDSASDQFGIDIGGVAEQADRDRRPVAAGAGDDVEGFIQAVRLAVKVARLQAHLDPRGLAFDGQARGTCHHGRQGLGASHATQAGGQDPSAGEIAAVMLPGDLGERLVSALHDPLGADVDPAPRGHLAIHHQALAVELMKVVPVGPGRHEVGIGDQHARRVGVGAKDADRLARLDQQRLVVVEPAQASRRSDRSSPSRALPGRCRRRRPAPRAARQPRGRGCSSASATAPRSASSVALLSGPRGARIDACLVDASHGAAPRLVLEPANCKQALRTCGSARPPSGRRERRRKVEASLSRRQARSVQRR